MAATLFYQPAYRWRLWLSFAAALAIHFAAVALAGIHSRAETALLSSGGDQQLLVTVELLPDVKNPPPPIPEEIDAPPSSADEQEFLEEAPKPLPAKPQSPKPQLPLVRYPETAGILPMSPAKVLALFAPRPDYPYEARRQKITGEGMALIIIDRSTGRVSDVTMQSGTGNSALDSATIAGLRRWRFRPGTLSRVRCPITFTLSGAQY